MQHIILSVRICLHILNIPGTEIKTALNDYPIWNFKILRLHAALQIGTLGLAGPKAA